MKKKYEKPNVEIINIDDSVLTGSNDLPYAKSINEE